VGKETCQRLRGLGITKTGMLRRTSPSALRAALGFGAEQLLRLSRGMDDRPVVPSADAKSIGRETTFEQDTDDHDVMTRVLRTLSDDVARRLRGDDLTGQTVTLKVRYRDFRTLTRSSTLAFPTDNGREIYEAACRMWVRMLPLAQPVRLLGIGVSRISRAASMQVELFGGALRRPDVDHLIDALNARFGEGTVRRARLMDGDRS
jgi:DNA polymerase IV